MATYYSNSNDQSDIPDSYFEPPGNRIMYVSSASYSDALTANSTVRQQEMVCSSQTEPQDFNAWRDSRNDMLLMHQQMNGSTNTLQGHGLLSLSLGTQIPIQYQNQNSGFVDGNFLDRDLRNDKYFTQNPVRTVSSSKYLKATQHLLDEVVSVHEALTNKKKDCQKSVGSNNEGTNEVSLTNHESTVKSESEGSPSEKMELHNKLTKLLSILEEVDRRYKQYYHQMQITVSSFDTIAGSGAAKPYTALALQTISRHFRCMRDTITNQIRVARTSLGEQQDSDLAAKGHVGISRLRYVDQQLKQQRAIQQLGMMHTQHMWRPQRGLPENSVSMLRAWLFEHFLHPYPKDSDKIMLARQTGLTRGQVSNWFINARVRLWKPMVEEMYKEEEAVAAVIDSNSSSENPSNARTCVTRSSDDKLEDSLTLGLQHFESGTLYNPAPSLPEHEIIDFDCMQ